jgi:methionyl aminopeptidase
MEKQEIEAYKKAGDIAKQVKDYARKIIKKDVLLSEIAEKIEAKIKALGAEPAFPVNLCIDDIAAHFTPTLNDETKASGLLKIDIGTHVEGFIADTAFTIDLTDNNEHKDMIKATENALAQAQKIITKDITLSEIGSTIHKAITDAGFSPVRNLSGHSLDEYQIHSGITVPSYENNNQNKIGIGAFAVEPFATTGIGMVYEGPDSSVYHLIKEVGQVRDAFAREILEYIQENKQWLPFSERELEREFKRNVKIALKRLEEAGIIKGYPQLIEKGRKPVSQAENTILIYKDKIEVTTE